MSRKRYNPEQIISMLREAEVALAQGPSVVAGIVVRFEDLKNDIGCPGGFGPTPIVRIDTLCRVVR